MNLTGNPAAIEALFTADADQLVFTRLGTPHCRFDGFCLAQHNRDFFIGQAALLGHPPGVPAPPRGQCECR